MLSRARKRLRFTLNRIYGLWKFQVTWYCELDEIINSIDVIFAPLFSETPMFDVPLAINQY